MDNKAGGQLFQEVVGSLAQAFSRYTNDPDKGNRISRIQGDSVGFAQSLSAAVEENYRWSSDRGLAIVKTAIVSIEYDQHTRELQGRAEGRRALRRPLAVLHEPGRRARCAGRRRERRRRGTGDVR